MDVTSDEIRSSRFQGTRHVYDRREIDAFLHRVAAALEVYERREAVTQSHIESLEHALELAQGRARSLRSREARIAELETALAAAQRNYEAAMGRLEILEAAALSPDTEALEVIEHARSRAVEILEEARRQGDDEAVRIRREAEIEAERTLENARADGEELIKLTATTAQQEADRVLQQAVAARERLLEEVEQAGAVEEDELRERLDELERKAEKSQEHSQNRIAVAEERAATAEAEHAALAEEVERLRIAAAAEYAALTEQAEGMAVAATARNDRPAAGGVDVTGDDTDGLRRQVARLRTALATLQASLRDPAGLSPQEIELTAGLADLDLGDEVIDLTAPEVPEVADEAAPVVLKSKWATLEPGHAPGDDRGFDETAAAGDYGASLPPTTWRDRAGPDAAPVEDEPASEPAPPREGLGFYERRLAGLRERLGAAMPQDD